MILILPYDAQLQRPDAARPDLDRPGLALDGQGERVPPALSRRLAPKEQQLLTRRDRIGPVDGPQVREDEGGDARPPGLQRPPRPAVVGVEARGTEHVDEVLFGAPALRRLLPQAVKDAVVGDEMLAGLLPQRDNLCRGRALGGDDVKVEVLLEDDDGRLAVHERRVLSRHRRGILQCVAKVVEDVR